MSNGGDPWLYIALLPLGMARGILSLLVPIYLVQEVGGTLIDLGMMTFSSTALLILASPYLGGLPDRHRRAKPFILVSLLGMSIASFLLSIINIISYFIIIYIFMNLLGYLEGPSISILIAESIEKGRRRSALAMRNFMKEMGGIAGLAICSLTINYVGGRNLLMLTSSALLISFIIALLFIHDPPIYIERFLDRYDHLIERIEGFSLYLRMDGRLDPDYERQIGWENNMVFFGIGRILFAFAASNAFTSLPIFLLNRAGFKPQSIFTVFLIRNIFMAFSFLASSRIVQDRGEKAIMLATGMRIILILLIPLATSLPYPLSALILVSTLSIIAFSWSLYALGGEMVLLTYVQQGRLGLYDALAMIGEALGCLTGGFIPELFGFEVMFMLSSVLFTLSLVLFILGLK